MEEYTKAIKILAKEILRLEKELSEAKETKELWYEKYQAIRQKYEPEEKK